MINFICMGLLELQGTGGKNYKMKKSCPKWESNPVPSTYETYALPIDPRDPISTIGYI